MRLLDEMSRRGTQGEIVDLIIAQPEVLTGVCETLQNKLIRQPGLFVPPDQQLESIRKWNQERGWGLTEQDLSVDTQITSQPIRGLVAKVMVVRLPDKDGVSGVERTFNEMVAIASSLYDTSISEVFSDPSYKLGLFDKVENRSPGVSGALVDLGGYIYPTKGMHAYDAISHESASAELLAALIQFPDWVRAMDCKYDVPFVAIPGYRLTAPNGMEFVPWIRWLKGPWSLDIGVVLADHRLHDTAFPHVVQ